MTAGLFHSAVARRRGQPLLVLGLVLSGWIGVRGAIIGAQLDGEALPYARAGALPVRGNAASNSADPLVPPTARAGREARFPAADEGADGSRAVQSFRHRRLPKSASHRTLRPMVSAGGAYPPHDTGTEGPGARGLAGGHQLLLLAGLAYIDLPEALRPALTAAAERNAPRLEPSPVAPKANSQSHWSGDGWFLLRRDADSASLATGAGAYGGSQFGAVVRYSLAPGNSLRPQLYLRATGAVGGGRDRQVALGLSVRPLSRVPVSLLAEGRVQQGASRTTVQPSVALVAGFGPKALPHGFDAEGYGQVGWVGGGDSTTFFDLQGAIDHEVPNPLAGTQLRLGGGAWAGGQRGAARLDIGPRVTLRATIAGTPSRLALDWRFRVAGEAEPGSGPALTLAAGF